MDIIKKVIHWISHWKWLLLFGAILFLSLVIRIPHLPKGHIDEMHTIGRSLNILYTNDWNPHFFNHPSGTMYLCVFADILAFASMSRDVEGRPGNGGLSPMELIQKEHPVPLSISIYDEPCSYWWTLFRYRVRFIFLMLVPIQMLLLWYIGKRLDLLVPAWLACVFLTLCPANRVDSVYVAVNMTTATFGLLAVALTTFYSQFPPAKTMWYWSFRLFFISLLIGLAAACKYNAGVFLAIPAVYGLLSMASMDDGKRFAIEKSLAGLGVMALGSIAGFTMLCPYWYSEFYQFVKDVLFQVWYFKVGHADYNTFKPGLQMGYVNLRCLADQQSWLGIMVTVISIVYLICSGFFRDNRFAKSISVFVPAFAGCLVYIIFMSFQAVFFDRNFTIIWPIYFLCCTAGWWFAAGLFAEKRNFANPIRFQTVFVVTLSVICLMKALWLDILLGPDRPWWRYHF